MEARLARLEEKAENIQSDVTELQVDIRRLDDKIDRLNIKVDGVKDSVAALTVTIQKTVTRLILWGVACFAALLATMARGFHWL